MDEFQIKVLEANGYSYLDGGIVDAEGNYLPSVELNGESFTSEVDSDLWHNARQVSDNNSNSTIENFQNFEKDPLSTHLSEDDRVMYDTYSQIKQENGEDTYENFDTYKNEHERKAADKEDDYAVELIKELRNEGYDNFTEEYEKEYKNVNKVVKNYQAEDPDYNKLVKDDTIDETIHLRRFGVDLERPNIPVLNQLYDVSKWALNSISEASTWFTPYGTGMEGTDEEKKEYKTAMKKRQDLLKPVYKVQKDKLTSQLEEVKKRWDKVGWLETGSYENNILRFIGNKLESQINNLDSTIDGDMIFNPFADTEYMIDAGTLGLQGVSDSFRYISILHDKLLKGEKLSANEQLAVEALANINKAESLPIEHNGLYNITKGTMDSLLFLVDGWEGRLVGEATGKAITRSIEKGLLEKSSVKWLPKVVGVGVGESVNMFGQAILHPSTYTTAINRYYGDIRFDKDENGETIITSDRRTQMSMYKEAVLAEEQIENMLAVENNPKKIEKLKQALKAARKRQEDTKPHSAFDSFAYGFNQTLNENITENYFGKSVEKLGGGWIAKQFETRPWLSRIKNSRLGKTYSAIDGGFIKIKGRFNTILGKEGLVGNNFEEIGEEIVNQLLPSYGESSKEAAERRAQLSDGSFYTQIVGQTLLMGGMMKAVYSPVTGYNKYKNWKDLREKRKNFKKIMSALKADGNSEARFETLLTSIGENNLSVQEYNNKINELRKEGKHSEANEVERNKIFNIGKSLVEMGRGKEFILGMKSLMAKGKLSPESISSINETIDEVRKLEKDSKEVENLPNRKLVLDLHSKLRYNNRQKERLENLKQKLESKGEENLSEAEKGRLDGVKEALKENEKYKGKLEKEIAHQTSSKKIKQLKKIQEVSTQGLKMYDAILKDYRKEYKLKEDEIVPDEVKAKARKFVLDKHLKDRYGKTISSGIYNEVEKNLDNVILSRLVEETKTKLAKQLQEQPKEEVKEPTEAQKHVEEIGESVDEVTQLVNEKAQDNLSDPTINVENNLSDPDSQTLPDKPEVVLGEELDDEESFFDDMPMNEKGEYDNEPFNKLVQTVKKRVEQLKKETGSKISFEDYIEDLIEEGQVPLNNLRDHMRALALAWSGAKYGKSNWKKLYNKLFNDTQAALKRQENSIKTEATLSEEEKIKQQKSEEKVTNKKSISEPIAYEPNTGEPIHVTPNKGKTYGTEYKVNFSGVEYIEVTEERDGKKIYVRKNHPVPKLNENSRVNFKNLVHPDKNNIGDRLKTKVLDGKEVADIPVAVRDSYGRVIKHIPFSQWVEENKGDLSLEEFKKTDKYIAKVPMHYIDNEGEAVAFVPEVEWFNFTTVGDRTKSVEEIDLDNPTESQKADIKENQEKTLALRKGIIDGTIKEMEIVDNLSFPPLQIIEKTDEEGNPIPVKILSEVAPDSRIVWMKGTGTIVDLDEKTIDMENILNLGDSEDGYLKSKKGEIDGVPYELPINGNKTHYLVHVATVNGVKKYIAFNVLRKDETLTKKHANTLDIETARWIAAANNVLHFHATSTGSSILNDKKHPLHMSLAEAENIRRQVKDITGIDIQDKYSDLITALVAFKVGENKKTKGKDVADALKEINKNTKELANNETSFVQNTSLSMQSRPMINISKNSEGSFEVKKIADTYEQHLKNRLQTNVMGYNVGTEANPKYTIAVQQKVILKPITEDHKTLDKKIEEQKKTPEVKEKIEEIESKETITELTKEQKDKRKKVYEDAVAVAKELNLNIRDIEESDDLVVNEMHTVEEVKNSIALLKNLTVKQEEELVKWFVSRLANKNTTFEEVKKEFEDTFKEKLEKVETQLKALEEFKDNAVVSNLIETLNSAKKQIEETLQNTNKILNEASLRAVNVSFITDEFEEDADLNEKDYSKKNNETKPIDKVGTAMKRIFAQITDGDKTGFMGIETYPSFKQMYDTILLHLSDSISLEANFNTMLALLEERKDSVDWMPKLIEELKSADEQVKNQFVYNMYKQKVNAKFATLAFTKNNGIDSRIYSSNSNESNRAIIDRWKENFKRAPINKNGYINTEELKLAIEERNKWFENGGVVNQTNETYIEWLKRFGIDVSEKTMQAIREGKLNVSENGGRFRPAKFKELFDGLTGKNNKNRTGLLFTNLLKYAMLNKDKKKLEFYNNTKNHPFAEMNSILEKLAELENNYNPSYNSTTRYIAGKTVTEVESFNYFYEQFKKLKKSALSDKEYLQKLKDLGFSKESIILDLLMNDEVFANQFEHGLVDLMSLKELFKKSPKFASIEELSSIDYMFVQRALFQYRNQGKERTVKGLDFDVRMATMNTLTNSDKGRMMLMKTAVFDFFKQSGKAFIINETSDISFSDDLKNLVYKQLVMPELRRMVRFISKEQSTNIKNYDKGAVRFNLIPGLNTLFSQGKNVSDLIRDNKGKSEEEILEFVKKEFFGDFTQYIERNIIKEALSNVETLKQFKQKEKGKEIDKFNNEDYLKQRQGSVEENMKIAELDFILNSMFTNMNYMQLMAGDPALYFKSKLDEESKDDVTQTKISQQLAINLGKRMAAMIAPGSVLSDSKGNTYMQVFLEDINGVADNIIDIVGWHYGKKALKEKAENGLTYESMLKEVKKGNREYIEILKERFSNIAGFIDIESTDAQEYTTLKEHLYVMEKQGRISQETLEVINGKIKKGEDLTKEELDLVLQPIKPVYTGTIYDIEQDVNRMMYIKSSSFPLIPQLTKGTKLDALRKNMEKVEEVTGKTVRASYQTANKVGALSSENTIKDFSQPIMPNNMLELNREHFKIQQDVPYKSKKVQDDTVSMGTQIFKLLMGDGIMEMEGFEYNGKTLTGKELKQEFFNIFSKMIGIKRNRFLKSLGLDNNMQSKNSEKTLQKLEKLLIKEAKSRGFSKQDLKILELVDDGNGGKTFRLPLWLTGNSNKYESMLNALINNKIFKQKIPGNKFVTGSEAGFEMSEDLSKIDESRVIWLGNNLGGPLDSTKTEEGKLKKAQVLLPSKFKLAGKLVDLFEDFNGTEGTYLKKDSKGVLRLKKGMIDNRLLEQFVFRIPTSSHGLGSSIEVAGFLPPESGDLIITPKSFIAQMGQDFDIDSLTAYQYNHVVFPDGTIKLLDEESKEEYVTQYNQQLEYLKKELKTIEESETGEPLYTEKVENILNTLGLDFKEVTDEDIEEQITELKKTALKNAELKILENQFIAIHNSVYSNEKAQKQINKELSMEYAEKQADDIESLTEKSSNSFNILSPKYQMEKMNAGSTGQDAIAIYAKGVTLHSLIQQAVGEGNEIGLAKKGKLKSIIIGKLKSDGRLGKEVALQSSNETIFEKFRRKISTILDERTNTGTDNEKAQILGRTGLNHTDAISVDNLLALLGFDSEFNLLTSVEYNKNKPFHRKKKVGTETIYYTEHSIPYLLHSQPIIKEYFDIINEKESITTEFSAKAKQEALELLLKKYSDVEGLPEGSERGVNGGEYGYWLGTGKSKVFYPTQDNTKFTAEMLQNQIELGKVSDKVSQLQILALYIDLISQAKNVKTMMQHVDLNNLGKSMWESTTKANEFREYFKNLAESGIIGAEHLIGETRYLAMGEVLQEGEIPLGDNMVLKPSTNQGVMVGTALSLNEHLFSDLFPAKNRYINEIIGKILENSKINMDNTYSVIEAKEKIFQEIKKYFTSTKSLGIFNKDAKKVREDLFIDRFNQGHLSLSSYIGNLFSNNSTEFTKGIEKVRGNLFLNHLKYNVGENGKPSLITFNNQESFDANQEAIYASFKELITEDYSLPRKNGEYYSTRILAQELIAYSYASGGIVQGAVEFHKFLPIEYLDDMTYTNNKGETIPISHRLRMFNKFNSIDGKSNILSKFIRQYFQNNPESAKQVKMKAHTLDNGLKVYTPTKETKESFIAEKVRTKSKLKQDKWKLYERVEGAHYYREIDILGENGMSEYEFGNSELTSSLGEEKQKVNNIPINEMSLVQDEKLGEIPKDGTKIHDFLGAIMNGEYGNYENIQEIAKFLLKFIPEGKLFNYSKGNFKGRTTDGKVYLNPSNIETNEELVTTFVHEIIHSITSKYINQYYDALGELRDDIEIPSEIFGLNNVLNEYRKQLSLENPTKYSEFMKKWEQYKKDKQTDIPSKVKFTDEELSIYYPAVNLKEFIATTLGNNREFKKKAGKMKYLATDKSLLKRFGDFISKFIKRIAKTEGIEENSVALQAISKSMELIESISNKKIETNEVEIEPEISKEEMKVMQEYYKDMPPDFVEDEQYMDYGVPDLSDPTTIKYDKVEESLLPTKKQIKKCN